MMLALKCDNLNISRRRHTLTGLAQHLEKEKAGRHISWKCIIGLNWPRHQSWVLAVRQVDEITIGRGRGLNGKFLSYLPPPIVPLTYCDQAIVCLWSALANIIHFYCNASGPLDVLLKPPLVSVKLISTKLTNIVSLEQSHHKPMGSMKSFPWCSVPAPPEKSLGKLLGH